ncbi:MAG: hypothetical protein LQ350_008658 [Teloschistes chrysophthalmus]|nr:MAG: hypothetical protein LQ350_008658 [Niorma chrysophthalma]
MATSSTPHLVPSKDQTFPLLRLPPEIREMVYHEALVLISPTNHCLCILYSEICVRKTSPKAPESPVVVVIQQSEEEPFPPTSAKVEFGTRMGPPNAATASSTSVRLSEYTEY